MKSLLRAGLVLGLILPRTADAVWIWSKETGFYNPKYAVKASAEEQYHYALDVFKKKDYGLARKLFKRVIKFFPDSKYCAEAQFMVAECYFMDKDYYHAYKEYETLKKQYPKHGRIQEVLAKEFEIGHLLCNGTKRKWIGGIPVPARGKGIEVMESVIKLDSWDDRADDALFEIGKTQYRKQQFDAANETFDRLVRDYPSSEHVAEAQYLKGMSSLAQDQGPEYDPSFAKAAARDFKVLKEEFQETEQAKSAAEKMQQMREAAARSHFRMVQYYMNNNKYLAAEIGLRALAKDYSDTSYGQKAGRMLQVLDTLGTPKP